MRCINVNNEVARYKRILKDIMIYLFINKKELAEHFALRDYDKGHTKLVRFGNKSYVIEIKICE